VGTTSLKLDLLKPTSLDGVIMLRARVMYMEGERATIASSMSVNGEETARAESQHVRLLF
jgi:hypothetical protein